MPHNNRLTKSPTPAPMGHYGSDKAYFSKAYYLLIKIVNHSFILKISIYVTLNSQCYFENVLFSLNPIETTIIISTSQMEELLHVETMEKLCLK